MTPEKTGTCIGFRSVSESVSDFLTPKILVSVSDVHETKRTNVGVGVGVELSDKQNPGVGDGRS